MRTYLLLALVAGSLHAAVLRGTVVESQTGHPLARTLVAVEPAPGTNGPKLSMRTNSYGIFEFTNLPAGSYLISASRRAFAPVQFGQRRWRGAGVPLAVAEGDSTTISIRLPRFGAITGTLLDENDVPLADHDVLVYRNTRPPFLLAKAKTDDRGMYRFFGLEPGAYLVRSMTKSDDEGTYLPTFYRDVMVVDQARSVEVGLDQQYDNVNIRPAPGRLFTLTGRVISPFSGPPNASISFISDTGIENAGTDSNGGFKFPPSAPGLYELLATANVRGTTYAAWQAVSLERDTGDVRLSLQPFPAVEFDLEDTSGHPVDPRQLQVLIRYKNLTGDAHSDVVRPNASLSLQPGRWDVGLSPNPNYYVASVTGPGVDRPTAATCADGWNEFVLTPGSQATVKLVLSPTTITVRGAVHGADGKPVANIPVFLEPFDLEKRKRLTEVRTGRTDSNGQYVFTGLAPGTYRLLGTFEYQSADSAIMDACSPKTVRLGAAREFIQDLDQYVIH